QVGKAVRVVVYREGKTETLLITLGRREEAEGAVPAVAPAPDAPTTSEVLGMTVSTLTDELRGELNLTAAVTGMVVTEVSEDSEAFEKNIRAGDVITQAGQRNIESMSDLQDRITEARDAGRKSLLLLVSRAGEPRFVALSLE